MSKQLFEYEYERSLAEIEANIEDIIDRWEIKHRAIVNRWHNKSTKIIDYKTKKDARN